MKRGRLLYVVWRDAVSNHLGWGKLEDIDKQRTPIVHSVGWVRRRTKTELTIVASIMDGEGSGDLTIGTGMIVSEKELAPK